MSIIYNPLPQYTDDDGNPLSAGTLTFFEANTSTSKAIFYDYELTVSAPNPITLDAGGRTTQAIYTTYPYKVKVEDSGKSVEWTTEYVDEGSGGSSATGFQVNSISALRGLTTQSSGDVATVKGYYTAGDQGGGTFIWRTDITNDDNNGTVIRPSGAPASGTWIRQVDDYLTPLMFGASYSDTTKDSSSAFNLMAIEADNGLVQRNIFIPSGNYQISGNISVTGDFSVKMDDQVTFFTNSSPASPFLVAFNCNSVETNQREYMVGSDKVQLSIFSKTPVEVALELFGDKSNTNSTILEYAYGAVTPNVTMVAYGLWTISGVINLFNGSKTIFRDEGEFNGLTGNLSEASIGEVTNETGVACFTGDYELWKSRVQEYNSNIFFDLDLSSGLDQIFENAFGFITNQGSKFGKFVWTDTFAFSGAFTGADHSDRTSNRFEGGLIGVTGTKVPIFGIEPTTDVIFQYNMTGFIIVNQFVDPRWFGAIPVSADDTYYATNHTAINLAFKSVTQSLTFLEGEVATGIDGFGMNYRISDSLLFNVGTENGEWIKIDNLNIEGLTTGFVSPSTGLIASAWNIWFNKCEIKWLYTSGGDGGYNIFRSTENTIIDDTDFISISGTATRNIVESRPFFRIENSSFLNIRVVNTNATDSRIVNNDFNGEFWFGGTVANTVCNRVLMEGNTIIADPGEIASGIFASTNIALSGHQFCSVKNNNFEGDTFNKLSTELALTVTSTTDPVVITNQLETRLYGLMVMDYKQD
jgi:hypothetical protein